ncbi:MAG: helix-turn-helix transcriptional regulator [Clostridia bacterium]|nr:helix-turn-helix transcriptional regulator [Clostridia bacterium]
MAIKKGLIDTNITTEDSRPFVTPKLYRYDNFYYDRSKRESVAATTNGHYHNMYEIYFLAEGRCRYFIENKLFEVEAGDLVLIPKGVIHKTIYFNEATDRYLINFSKPYITPSLAIDIYNLFALNIYRPPKDTIPEITAIFEKISKEHQNFDSYSNLLISGYMTELFSLMLRNPSMDKPYSRTNIPIENVTQYISANYRMNLTLEQMAEMSSLSTSYFSRLFKSITGFGFKEYLTIIRLKEAQSRLIHTDKSICKIAYECGFNDSNYFSSVFKELNGVSPLKYRKQNRIKAENPGRRSKRIQTEEEVQS